MSATNRSAGVRDPDDYYATPGWCVDRLLDAIALPRGEWLEPAAGNGRIIRAANQRISDIEWTAIELRDEHTKSIRDCNGIVDLKIGDFTRCTVRAGFFDVAITNPPFSLARQYIERCLKLAETTVLLLRLNAAAGALSGLMRDTGPSCYVLPNRPSWNGKGSDATEYGWFVWRRGQRGGRFEILGETTDEDISRWNRITRRDNLLREHGRR